MDALETEARRRLAEAERAVDPAQTLTLALAAAEASLREGSPADGQPLASLAQAASGRSLDKRDAAQLVRLSLVAQRAQTGAAVDPLDAEQALALAKRLADRTSPPTPPLLGEGEQTTDPPASALAPPSLLGTGAGGLGPWPPSADTSPPPLAREGGQTAENAPPPFVVKSGTGMLLPRPIAKPIAPPPLAPPVSYEPPPAAAYITIVEPVNVRQPSLVWNILGFTIWAIVTLVIMTLGPLVLALLGPAWVRWLVWPVGLVTGWLALRCLLRVATRGVGQAVVMALGVSVGLGVAWGVAAETGWMPPLDYVVNAPLPSLSGLRPAPDAALHVGGRARVQGTQGTGLRVRTGASVNADEVTRLPDGTTVRLMAGPRDADGFRWWQAEGNSTVGWVADEWLQPLD